MLDNYTECLFCPVNGKMKTIGDAINGKGKGKGNDILGKSLSKCVFPTY